jgi:hypothetical protein
VGVAGQLSPDGIGTERVADAFAAVKPHGVFASAERLRALNLQPRGGESKAVSWRDPAMSTAIRSAHQKVVGEKIVTVAADAPWVNAGMALTPGQRMWIDTRSDGRWSGNPRFFPYSDAKGLSVYPGQYRVDAKARVESLIGFIGSSPPTPREVSVGLSARPGGPGGTTNRGFVEIGDTLVNFTPRTVGQIWLRNNDNTNYISDVGHQIVKVIVTAGAP